MPVPSEDKIRFHRNGAVHEFVVVWVGGDYLKPEMRLNIKHVIVKPRNAVKKPPNHLPSGLTRKPSQAFLIFEQDFVGDREF